MELYDYSGRSIFSSDFDALPVVRITGTIPTRKEVIENIEISFASPDVSFNCYGTIKVQGHTTVNFPKQNYNVKLYEDAEMTTKKKVKFKNWKKNSKFTIKANYTDFSQSRNIVCSQLFCDMYKARPDFASLPDRVKNSPVGIDGFPVQVYLNDVYYGIYTWNQPKDALFDIDDDVETECLMMGNSNENNINTAMSVWTDETHDTMPEVIATAWADVLSFISTSSDSAFTSGIGDKIDLTSIIDQFIMFVISYAYDDTGNNVMFATYDTEFWYGGLYDYDKSCGNSGSINAAFLDIRSPLVAWPMGNNIAFKLYNRVFANFYSEVKSRYLALRQTALADEAVANKFYNFSKQIPDGLLELNFAPTTGGGAFVDNANRNDVAQAIGFMIIRLGLVDAWFKTDYFSRILLTS